MKPETLEILALFSNPLRVATMEMMGKRPMTIDEVVANLDVNRASVNAYVFALRNARCLLQSGGRPKHYELDKARLKSALAELSRALRLDQPVKTKPAAKSAKGTAKKATRRSTKTTRKTGR